MIHETVLSFEYDDPERSLRIDRAIRPEVGDIDGERTDVSVERRGDGLYIHVTATDLVALRAGVNTWSTLVDVAERTHENPTIDEQTGAVRKDP